MSLIEITIADLNKQERRLLMQASTYVRDIRSHYGYGTGVCLYSSMTRLDVDQPLSRYDLRNGARLEFRMWRHNIYNLF